MLHSDDIFLSKGLLENVVNLFSETNCDALYGDLIYVRQNDPSKIIRYWKSGSLSKRKVNLGWMPPHPTLFITKQLLQKTGLYILSYPISSDYEYILRIFRNPDLKIIYLPEVMVKMRLGGNSNRGIAKLIQKTYEDYKIMRLHQLPNPMLALALKKLSKVPQFLIGG